MGKRITSLFLISILTLTNAFSQVDSEFRGPNRNGKYENEKLLKQWPDGGPKLVKTISGLGQGFTSAAVTNDRIYITGMLETTGYLFSYDLSGNLLWKKPYGEEWTSNYPGSRSTPTIVGDKIYFTDAFGMIYCYDKSGEQTWTVDMKKEFGFREIDFGANEGLLIEGDNLFCTPGGKNAMMAILDRHTGNTLKIIKGNGQKSAHCSPIIINHNNKRILITYMGRSVVGVDMESFEILFEDELTNQWEHNPNTPIYKNGYLFISTYVVGSKMLKIAEDGKSVTTVWEEKLFDSEAESAMEIDGYIYLGAGGNKTWYCIDWNTGKIMHSDNKIVKKANSIFADGLLYTYNSNGYISLIKPNPQKLELICQFKIKQGSKWHVAHLVIKKGKLYVRHGDILNIYDIARL